MKILKWMVLFSLFTPFLVCDPDLSFDGIKIQFDGGAWVEGVVVRGPVGVSLHHDLASILSGRHTVKAKSYNLWGESIESDPFTFDKVVPVAPGTLRVEP